MKHYMALADCDCFFVSAERAFNRKLEGIPVAVLSNNDGCVVSRSREAKALGLKMGEPYFMARPRLPDILYVRANHDLYHATSEKVMAMFRSFTPEVEVCSVDEAYLDLTGTKLLYKQNYIKTARMIRENVWKKLHIPVSIGLSTTKTLAKLASDKAKNCDGIYAIGAAKRRKILAQTKIEDVAGVGRKLIIKMREGCIFTALDFISRPDHWIKAQFGTHGTDLKAELSGLSLFKITPQGKAPLSIQQTAALKEFSRDLDILQKALLEHIHTACRKARQEGAKAQQIEVMLRTKDFRVITQRLKLPYASNQETEIIPPALKLLSNMYSPAVIWRSVGITLSGLMYGAILQNDLFSKPQQSDERLGKAMDELEAKFGKNIIHLG
ncbi:MAG: hypothetical protein NC218_11230 [Acetobacter sp.]|nr:hypothetical protein [Acetobacter sp.]